MSKIYKYQLKIGVPQVVSIKAKKVLACQEQCGYLMVWVEIDEFAPTQDVTFLVVGTGWEVDLSTYTYLSTAQSNGFVWHCYYRFGKGE